MEVDGVSGNRTSGVLTVLVCQLSRLYRPIARTTVNAYVDFTSDGKREVEGSDGLRFRVGAH